MSGADSCNYPSHGEQLYAYSLPGGQLRWKRGLKGACNDFHPVDPVSNGIVAVAAWPALEGWSASDGSTRWRSTRFPGAVRQSADRIVSVDSNTGAVRFLDPLDGRLLQTGVARSKPFPWAVTPTEAILVTQGSDDPVVERLTALDPASGRRLWRQTLGPTGGFGAPSGADGVVLAGWEGATRSLAETARVSYAAFDAGSGRRLWLRRGFLDLEAAGSGLALFEQRRHGRGRRPADGCAPLAPAAPGVASRLPHDRRGRGSGRRDRPRQGHRAALPRRGGQVVAAVADGRPRRIRPLRDQRGDARDPRTVIVVHALRRVAVSAPRSARARSRPRVRDRPAPPGARGRARS